MRKTKMIALLTAAVMAVPLSFPAHAETVVTNAGQLEAAMTGGGEIVIAADFSIDQLRIDSNLTIDGAGHTLVSANRSLVDATVANKRDGLAATFKNIIFDGGGQVKTDTCLWMGRGSWDWYNVTAQNWNSSSLGNRGALTLGKSQDSPGLMNIHNSKIINNHMGLSLDQSQTVANIYGCVIEENEKADVNITSGTLNFIDDNEKSEKRVGKLIMSGGTLNISGNTAISEIVKNGGSINITGELTSDSVIKISLPRYTAGVQAASLWNGADSGILRHFALADDAPEGCVLEVVGNSLLVVNPNDVYEGSVISVDYSTVLGKSSRLASGSLHAIDFKTPAKWLTDGIELNAIRGQAHQHEFDANYEYIPGVFDDMTYERIMENNPETTLMVGLYYGFKPQYGGNWQNAALENGGEKWKSYITDFLKAAEGKKVYSWIPWNEPDAQWGQRFATDYRKAYRYAYEAVKACDASARVQAPETCKYSFDEITGFLTYCKENNCIPDVLAWHELTATRSDTEAHCRELYNWLVKNNIEPMPFAITEYQGTGYGTTDEARIAQETYNPGLGAAFIAGMERAEKYNFKFGLQSAWGLPGDNPAYQTDLGQMADFAGGNMPTGLWYVYNAYRLMTGVKVEARADFADLECFATTDASVDGARSVVLLGNWKAEDKTATVKLRNIPGYLTNNGRLHIEAELINETLATACYGTEILISADREVKDGSCSVTFPVKGRSAVVLKLTPGLEKAAEIPAAELQYTLSGAMTADGNRVLTVSGGRPSSYTAADGNRKSYAETGDKADFTINAPKDGLYNLSVTHSRAPQNGFVQLYADGVSFGTPTDMYGAAQGDFTKNYGNIYLTAGDHSFSFRLVGTGKNEASKGCELTFVSFVLSEVTPAGHVLSFDCMPDMYVYEAPEYLPTPERDGYTFLGWKTAEGEEVAVGSPVTEDLMLYAQWKENNGYKVSVYAAGCESSVREAYVNDGESLEIELKPDNGRHVPTVTVNGADAGRSVQKAGDSYLLRLDVTEDTIVLASFDMPYSFESAWSRGDYETIALDKSYTGLAVFEYDITPLAFSDGFVGFCGSDNTPDNWNSFNAMVRLCPDGTMDARNYNRFEAASVIRYEIGKTYKIKIAIDVKNKSFSAWVYDENGKPAKVADNYGFRDDAPPTEDISKICVRGGYQTAAELFYIEGFREVPACEIISRDEAEGTVRVFSARNESAVLVCAMYNGGVLESVSTKEVGLAEGENTFSLGALKNAGTAVMLWKDMTTMRPLCEKYN